MADLNETARSAAWRRRNARREARQELTPNERRLPAMWLGLRTHAEPMPDWLASFNGNSAFDINEFLRSRVVYYPGSGGDGHPLRTFGKPHAAHCFVYADSSETLTPEWILADLTDASRGRKVHGYRLAQWRSLRMEDLAPAMWQSHFTFPDDGRAPVPCSPFVALAILDREFGFSDNHGPDRLAMLFVGDDGNALFDALWCQRNSTPPPFAVVAISHGFGGDWHSRSFEASGLLGALMADHEARPRFILTRWSQCPGYTLAPFRPSFGCGHHEKRFLLVRGDDGQDCA